MSIYIVWSRFATFYFEKTQAVHWIEITKVKKVETAAAAKERSGRGTSRRNGSHQSHELELRRRRHGRRWQKDLAATAAAAAIMPFNFVSDTPQMGQQRNWDLRGEAEASGTLLLFYFFSTFITPSQHVGAGLCTFWQLNAAMSPWFRHGKGSLSLRRRLELPLCCLSNWAKREKEGRKRPRSSRCVAEMGVQPWEAENLAQIRSNPPPGKLPMKGKSSAGTI